MLQTYNFSRIHIGHFGHPVLFKLIHDTTHYTNMEYQKNSLNCNNNILSKII